MRQREEIIKELLKDPEKLLQKKPFYRGMSVQSGLGLCPTDVSLNGTLTASLPNIRKRVISQAEYMMELDPACHKVLFDQNVPSITMKLSPEQGGGFVEIQYQKMAVSFQRNIKDKQVLHLCGNKMDFTLMDTEPSEQQSKDYVTIKQYWDLRNQDGMKTKMVDTQKSFGDAGLLYYFTPAGEIKSRVLSYSDGFVLCPHNDDNGDRVLESVYYSRDGVEYIDSYDNKYMYRYVKDVVGNNPNGWVISEIKEHGFSEIPLITKRGDVAWDNVQSIIEDYEVLYNIFMVIQKRHGWGILYIKGRFDESGRKIAGAVILNDKSMDEHTDAKFLTPPSPQGTIETLQLLEETIQKSSSTTFILPKDIKSSGDISGIAILLTLSMDIENALQGVIEWQNVASKMCRLFKEGLAKELVSKGIQPTAITDFENLHINAKFVVWRPQSETELVNRLGAGIGAGILSIESAVDKNPDASPDEKNRIKKEKEAKLEEEIMSQERTVQISAQYAKKEESNTKE